ncbi:MAG: leucine-rich repeat domain-containing protein [Verrucomicrobiales bacterium]
MTRRVTLTLILALCALFAGCGEQGKPAPKPAVRAGGLKIAAWNLQWFPDSVTSIGHGTFRDCIKLTSIIIPDGVTSIEGSTFSHCSGLTSINIPDGVTSIGTSAFYLCESLTSITIS